MELASETPRFERKEAGKNVRLNKRLERTVTIAGTVTAKKPV